MRHVLLTMSNDSPSSDLQMTGADLDVAAADPPISGSAVLTGAPGQLVDRLLLALGPPSAANALGHLTELVARDIVGLQAVLPLRDEADQRDPRRQWTGRSGSEVDPDAYVRLMRDRLLAIVWSGLSEEFLVRALRDWVDRWIGTWADTEAIDAHRAELRAELEESAEDTARLDVHRRSFSKTTPGAENLSDDHVADILRMMAANPLLREVPPEQAAGNRTLQGLWQDRRACLLSDNHLETWQLGRVAEPQPHG